MGNKEAVEKYRKTEKGKISAAKKSKTFRENHPEKCKTWLSKWRARNPEKVALHTFTRICKRHHLTTQEYYAILERQGNVCALCQLPAQGEKLVIDHDHSCCPGHFSCGECIRGLIHNNCNKALGFLGDDPEKAKLAQLYLLGYRVKEKGMSSFRQQQTEITDQKCLEEALKGLNYKPVVSETKQNVRGHYNESRKAEIVLKKEDLKEGGDVGFSKGTDGKFTIVTDTYVMRNGFNLEKFTKEVKQKYAEVKVRKQAAAAGLTFLRKVDNGNGGFKLQFVAA